MDGRRKTPRYSSPRTEGAVQINQLLGAEGTFLTTEVEDENRNSNVSEGEGDNTQVQLTEA